MRAAAVSHFRMSLFRDNETRNVLVVAASLRMPTKADFDFSG
jgi:hypothetical protein